MQQKDGKIIKVSKLLFCCHANDKFEGKLEVTFFEEVIKAQYKFNFVRIKGYPKFSFSRITFRWVVIKAFSGFLFSD